MAAGWQVIAAAELVQAGLDARSILARLPAIRARVQMAFTPLNLKYLIASGRVPRLKGFVGDLLDIKPVMLGTDGLLEPVARVRTQRKALDHMVDLVKSKVGTSRCRLAVGHCNVPDEAAAFARQVKQQLNTTECIIFDLGMLAALGGPGLLGMTTYTLEDS
jgi:DegV family protein with EDD domain